MPERLQKIIASCGICSRRKAEELIQQGLVRVNGETAVLGMTAELSVDRIEVSGVLLQKPEEKRTLLLYKPRGYVTTASDEKGRKTVLDLVPGETRLFPVGRLDLNSEGLLLLTNDGELANRLMHPSKEVDKVYHAWVTGWQDGALALLRRPIELDGAAIREPKIRLLHESEGQAKLSIIIHEGKNRQVRRMCERAGLNVTRLKRVAEGKLRLGDLKPGQYRELTAEELQSLSEI